MNAEIRNLIDSLSFTASSGNKGQAQVVESVGYKAHVDVFWDNTPSATDTEEFNHWIETSAPVTVDYSVANLPADEEVQLVKAFLAPEN